MLNADMVVSHKEPVTCCRYNPEFKQVITCCSGSVRRQCCICVFIP